MIKSPYASLNLATDPPGATVRNGRNVPGPDPAHAVQPAARQPPPFRRSAALHDADAWTSTWVRLRNVSKNVTLAKEQATSSPRAGCRWSGFPTANSGRQIPMVQSEFEVVARSNPSFFRNPNRPVESISWDNANAFCDKLNKFERRPGRLPHGFHTRCRPRAQWCSSPPMRTSTTARCRAISPLSSTQDVGYPRRTSTGSTTPSATSGNGASTTVDDKGDHRLRGGSWLSSTDNFPDARHAQRRPCRRTPTGSPASASCSCRIEDAVVAALVSAWTLR